LDILSIPAAVVPPSFAPAPAASQVLVE